VINIKKLFEKAKQFFTGNLIEALIFIGAFFIFAGLYMIYIPLSFLAVGIIILFLAYLLYKNQ